MKKYLVLILCLATAITYGQNVTKVGTTAAGFLNIDLGARAIGMGGAYVSVADDAMSMYWNPAGIAAMPTGEAFFTYAQWLVDIKLNYAGFAMPVGNAGAVGISANFMTMDDMERTTIAEPDGTGEMFGAGSYVFNLTYAHNLTDRFAIGGTFKYLQEKIYHSTASGVAFDIGTLFTTQYNGLKIGMSITNYGSKMQMSGRDMLIQTDIDPQINGNNENINGNLATDEFDLPLMFRVGISMDMLRTVEQNSLIVSIDALHPNDDVEYVNIGAEYGWNDMLFLRGGFKTLFAQDSEEGLCLGAGFHYTVGGSKLMFDYAFQDFGVLKNVQMFTLGLGF